MAMSEAEVKELFGSCGRISVVALDRPAYTSGTEPKGATVTFDTDAEAAEALKLDGTKMRSVMLRVELATAHGARAGARPY